ncbi:MAG: SO_0444 family Cu/Zn efflux transporter [Thiotrichales bacterium]|nr:MAG: SO_0444 family Cu/Zn efflux transporter [Thiotrichales bacterium]
MTELLLNIWSVFLDTAFWLLLGLFAAGLIKSFIAEDTMQRWVGGSGFAAVSRAALFGAPLPLCSCGVLPAAIGLHRSGASKEATVSFLISTPETSVDSIAVTYALMGPVMAVYRPFAALVSAIVTGMMTTLAGSKAVAPREVADTATTSCCQPAEPAGSSCCAGDENVAAAEACCAPESAVAKKQSRLLSAIIYAASELLDDIAAWMAVGIIIAGVMLTYIPPDWLAQWGQGVFAMLVMLVIGVPMYICAVASTPVAAGLILAGVSPGVALVFLLVGPATNIAGLALVSKELGFRVTLIYLAGIAVVSVAMGLLLEYLLQTTSWQVDVRLGEASMMMPMLLTWGSAILLLILAIKPLRRTLFPVLG